MKDEMAYPENRRPNLGVGAPVLARLPQPPQVALAAAVGIASLVAIGAIDLFVTPLGAFALDGERTVPAFFSAALLLGAGLVAWQLSNSLGAGSSRLALWSRFIGVFFVFMAFDELLAIHERVSDPITGVSWQVFYAPLVAVAAFGWLAILRRLPSRRLQALWLGGAAAWFAAQVIEAVQWDNNELLHPWTIVPEELLEMTGSLMWGLVLLLTLRLALGAVEGGDDQRLGPLLGEPETRIAARRRRRRIRGADKQKARTGRTPSVR